MMTIDERVEWFGLRIHGDRSTELFFIIAERDETGWRFFERGMYDWSWFALETTPGLVATAEEIVEEKTYQKVAACATEEMSI